MHNPRHPPKKSHSVSLCINKPFLVRFCVITAFFDRGALWGSCSTPYIPQHTRCSTLYHHSTLYSTVGSHHFMSEEQKALVFAKRLVNLNRTARAVRHRTLPNTVVCTKRSGVGFFLRVSRVMHLAVISHCENNHQCYHVYR